MIVRNSLFDARVEKKRERIHGENSINLFLCVLEVGMLLMSTYEWYSKKIIIIEIHSVFDSHFGKSGVAGSEQS